MKTSPAKFRTSTLLSLLSAAIILFFITPSLMAGSFYKWRDKNGTIHFTDSITNVPAEYYNQLNVYKANDRTHTAEHLQAAVNEGSSRMEAEVNRKTNQTNNYQYEIPYTANEGTTRRVIIEATLNDSVTAPMLLDTGAFEMIISVDLADDLGLFDQEGNSLLTMVAGLGGTQPALRTIIDTIKVGEAGQSFIPVKIVAPISDSFKGIIGLDFLGDFSFTFDTAKQVVKMNNVSAVSNLPAGRDETWWRKYFNEFTYYQNYWEKHQTIVNRVIRNAATSSEKERLTRVKDFIDAQYLESEALFNKLERHAIENSVPMHWRR